MKYLKTFNEKLNLSEDIFEKAYKYIVENNEGNSNPYHNNKHMFFVFNTSLELFDMYKDEYNLTSEDRYELGLAAIFHDFNHSGGKLKDDGNIELAIKGLNDFLDKYEIDINRENVIDILGSTEFPHKDIELNILQKIIRDSDLVGGIKGEGYMDIVMSLAEEWNKTIEEIVPMQINFLDGIKFNTSYCQELLDERKDILKKELLNLLD